MVKLTFLGTKGEIEEFNEKHKYTSSVLMTSGKTKLMIDYGRLRHRDINQVRPEALLITHAHPDTYAWLKEDITTDVPVYLTEETYDYGKFRPANANVYKPGEEMQTNGFSWMGYRVIHSLRAPAVGYKIRVDGKTIVYNSDVVDIENKDNILSGVDIYIGDGSSIRANLVRRRDDKLFGHARITTQINWCKAHDIQTIIFTHLGKETIEHEAKFQSDHPDIIMAYDGMKKDI